MRRIPIAVSLFALLLSLTAGCQNKQDAKELTLLEPPAAPREFRGGWVATVGNIDWPSKPGLSTDEQKAQAIAILDKCVDLNLNAVIFQVRPSCDALYDSKIEPWSYFLTGQQGKAPDPYYDPLKFWVQEAHRRGLELHAWFNPYRAGHPGDKSAVAKNHISKTHPEAVKTTGEFLWLDPGERAAQDQTFKVFMDVCKRYDVDGLHIDDYFYPYPEYLKGGQFPDEESWRQYQASGGKLSRDDWRRENVDKLIHRIYDGIKDEKERVKFGISPFGIGHARPEGVKGFDPYDKLYADAEKWWMAGWCDYLTPQLYWKIDAPQQPYGALLQFWAMENQLHRNLWPGNFTSRIGEPAAPTTGPSSRQAATMSSTDIQKMRSDREAARRRNMWTAQEIVDQIELTRQTAGATGNVHFSMKAFLRDSGHVNEALKDGPYKNQALVPVSPWLDSKAPDKPSVHIKRDGEKATAHWKPAWKLFGGEKPWLWAVYIKRGEAWEIKVLPAETRSLDLSAGSDGQKVSAVAVSQVDRCGNESKRNVQEVK
jgi:uncharacterized lipoprotein YddW (UPF0748 family)